MICLGSFLASPSLAQSDTLTISAPETGVWGASVVMLQPELRIGTLDGPPEYTFGRVRDVAWAPGGSIFVLDAFGPQILQYSDDGQFLRLVGRSGSGPGEYKEVLGIEITPEGLLAIWDVGNARISLFDSAGTFVEAWRVESGLRTAAAPMFVVDTAGYFYVRRPARTRLSSGWEWPTEFVRMTRGGDIAGIVPLPLGGSDVPRFLLIAPSGPLFNFITERRSTLSPHGFLVVGENTDYTFTMLRPDGPLKISKTYDPVRIGREERAEWAAVMRGRGGVPNVNVKPAFRDLVVDQDGRTWVDRYVRAQKITPSDEGRPPRLTWREPRTFDVFSSRGSYLGTVVFPPRTRFVSTAGMYVWGVSKGEFGEDYVVRMTLPPTPERS